MNSDKLVLKNDKSSHWFGLKSQLTFNRGEKMIKGNLLKGELEKTDR
jgi:hypothetical protein